MTAKGGSCYRVQSCGWLQTLYAGSHGTSSRCCLIITTQMLACQVLLTEAIVILIVVTIMPAISILS